MLSSLDSFSPLDSLDWTGQVIKTAPVINLSLTGIITNAFIHVTCFGDYTIFRTMLPPFDFNDTIMASMLGYPLVNSEEVPSEFTELVIDLADNVLVDKYNALQYH